MDPSPEDGPGQEEQHRPIARGKTGAEVKGRAPSLGRELHCFSLMVSKSVRLANDADSVGIGRPVLPAEGSGGMCWLFPESMGDR